MKDSACLKRRDIAVLGRATVDFYPDSFGKLENVRNFHMFLGGSTANTAVALTNAYCDVALIGKVSDDPLGRFVKKELSDKGIDTTNVFDDNTGRRSGLTVAELESNTSNKCFVYRTKAADLNLNSEEIKESFISDFDYLLISGSALTESPAREAALLAAEYAGKNGVKIVFDPDYRKDTWYNEEETIEYYGKMAELSDIIFATEEEFWFIKKYYGKELTELQCVKCLLEKNAKYVCVKYGAKGANMYTHEGTFTGTIFNTEVVNTFGAGDSFCGTCLALIIRGNSIEEAMRYAAAAAAITVSGNACADSMPAWDTLVKYVESKPDGGKVTFKFW